MLLNTIMSTRLTNYLKIPKFFIGKDGKNTFYAYAKHLSSFSLHSDVGEIEHHANIADWWSPNGELKGLHSLNELRVPFIRDGLIATRMIKPELADTTKVLDHINILEVGCGAGILSEQLARLHANVMGIDLGEEVIRKARTHLKNESPELLDRIVYEVESIEEHCKNQSNKYNAVVISEVIEHVTDKIGFLRACVETVKPSGSIFITTPNRTLLMYLSGIILAENVLNLVPKGTHHYEKFIKPIELQRILESIDCTTVLINGCTYEFWSNTWKWIPSTSMSYALQAVKNE